MDLSSVHYRRLIHCQRRARIFLVLFLDPAISPLKVRYFQTHEYSLNTPHVIVSLNITQLIGFPYIFECLGVDNGARLFKRKSVHLFNITKSRSDSVHKVCMVRRSVLHSQDVGRINLLFIFASVKGADFRCPYMRN